MKLKNILLTTGLAIAFISCKKIEIQPTGQVPPDKAIKSEADVLAILNGMYTPFRGDNFYGGRFQIVSELMADVVDGANLQGDYLVLNRFTSGGGTGTSANLYREPYIIIQRGNVALENLALVSESNKKNVEGQAKFMRGFALFEMVRLFAQPYGYTTDNVHPGLVIKTTSKQELGLKRNTVKEVYDQIISDLKIAETLLPPTNGNYPGNLAAKAILARVYFQMNDFANAYNYANQVITSNQFTFDNSPNFITNRFSDPKTSEAVWWIINEPGLGASFGPLRNTTNPNISMGLPITRSAYDEYRINPNDLRRSWYKDSTAPGTSNTTYSVKKI